MTAYYNEFNPAAAATLRNLIAEGLIAPGVVDERSIADVTPGDLAGFTQVHFFAGIGGWSLALRLAGVPDGRRVWTGSTPCQPFSSAGAGGGFDDERHLWPAFDHHVRVGRPPEVFGEQVASSLVDPWLDLVQADLEGLGYAFGAVAFPSASVGAPHIRDRCYWGGRLGDADLAGLEGHGGRHQASLRYGQGAAGPAAAPGQPVWLADGDAHRRAPLSGTGCADAERHAEPRGEFGRLADADREGSQGRAALLESGDDRHGGAADRLGHADSVGAGRDGRAVRGSIAGQDGQHAADDAGASGVAGWLADGTCGGQPQGHGPDGGHAAGHGSADHGQLDDHGPGAVTGFWRDADWLACRDGKWRPVEPGTQPLAHGLPRSLGSGVPGLAELARVAGLDARTLAAAKSYRVDALHGYGNAINPYAAAAFLKAFYGAN